MLLSSLWTYTVSFCVSKIWCLGPAIVNETPVFGQFCLTLGQCEPGIRCAYFGLVNARKKLARLSKSEDATYGNAFAEYFNNVRRSNVRADRWAWRECQRVHPRLKKYQGALP